MDRLLSAIDPRVFVMHNVHDNSGPFPMHTRWAMSFLRGPLTRQQIRTLMADQRENPYYPYQQPAYGAPPVGSTQPYGTQPYGTQPYAAPAARDARARRSTVPPGATPPPTSLPELPPPCPTLMRVGFRGGPARAAAPVSAEWTQQQTQGFARPAAGGVTQPTGGRTSAGSGLPEGFSLTPPPLPSTVAQYYLPTELSMQQAVSAWERRTGIRAQSYGGSLILYESFLIAQAEIRYADRKSGVNAVDAHAYHIANVPKAGLIQWDEYRAPYVDTRDISQSPFGDAAYGDLSPGLTDSKRMTVLKNELVDYLYKTAGMTLLYNPELGLYSQPGMRKRDFLVQAQNIARQNRDQEIDQIAAKYDKQFDGLEAKMRKTARSLDAERKQLDTAKSEELFTTGEALLSLLAGPHDLHARA
jgi:hypothetical protein